MVRYGVAAASVVLLLATSGCGKQATGQTVAVVNGEEISSAELNAELAAANIPETADKKQVMPLLLQRLVDRRIMAQQAVEQGVDRTPEYLTRQRRMNEELLIGLLMKRQSDAIKAPDQKAIDAFMAANPQMFGQREMLTLNQLAFRAPADRSVLQPLEDDHSLDAVAATLKDLGIAGERRTTQLDTASAPADLMRQINGLPAGEPFIIQNGPVMVANVVTARQPAGLSADQQRRAAVEAMRRQQLGETMQKQLKQLKDSAKIEYQPGYAPPKAGAPAPGAATGKAKTS
jgi:peptidyl-prolyl cis-trans isomerase C